MRRCLPSGSAMRSLNVIFSVCGSVFTLVRLTPVVSCSICSAVHRDTHRSREGPTGSTH